MELDDNLWQSVVFESEDCVQLWIKVISVSSLCLCT